MGDVLTAGLRGAAFTDPEKRLRLGRASPPESCWCLLVLVALAAATADAVEDGMGVEPAGSVYFVPVSPTMLTLLALAGMLVASRPRWPGVVVLITLIGRLSLGREAGFWSSSGGVQRP